jgi:hypothetical protein
MPTYLGNQLYSDIRLGTQRINDIGVSKFPLAIDYLIVAGGGQGGVGNGSTSNAKGGGGGGGGYLTGSAIVYPNSTNLSVVVGEGGFQSLFKDGENGFNSSFNSQTAIGGGGGGGTGNNNGKNGGSGGGAHDTGAAGNGTAGQGNNGGTASGGKGGNGGGAGSAGGSGTGGSGLTWFNGVTYSIGGAGADGSGGGTTAGCGGNGKKDDSFIGTNGQDGIVIVRYVGPPLASGGTITQSGGYTYHSYPIVGTYTFTY